MRDFSHDFSIYIHIPFCVSKCAYCDFLSFADTSRMDEYFSALEREIRVKGREMGGCVDNIYIGGGTPSLAYPYFVRLRKALDEEFFVRDGAEISMECNPESVTPEFIDAAKAIGVNRVSLGVQSLSDPLLRVIGRAHDRQKALDALDSLTKEFPAVNVDIMVGLPGQSEKDVAETLGTVLSYPISHLSCYSLILEEGTPLCAAAERGEFALDDDYAVDLYDRARERLSATGFHRYEISNFCKGDAVCAYNLSVWQYGEYLGFGLGASSFLRKGEGDFAVRLKNADDMSVYISSSGREGGLREEIVREEGEREFIMLALRLEEGLDLASFYEIFGFDFMQKYGEKVKKLSKMLCVTKQKVAIAPEYFYVSNSIIEELIY